MTESHTLGLEVNTPKILPLLTIDSIHDKLNTLLETYSLECDYQATQDLFTKAEYELQSLWGFEQDSSKHKWTKRLHARHQRLLFPDNNYTI